MTARAGDRIPDATLFRRVDGEIETIETSSFFAGRRIVLFGLPGAFTPTCSETHLPGFVEHAGAIRARGVDAVVCVAVNDPYVMEAWGLELDVRDELLLLSDGNGELTRAMGLEVDLSASGLGIRSRRYAALVEDGVIGFLEVETRPGVHVSGAEQVLAGL